MATATIDKSRDRQFGGFSPYGNTTTLRFGVTTDSTGKVENSDATAAAAIGDVIILGELPAGMRLDSASLLIETTFTASVVLDLGFQYVDGVDDATYPQSANFFINDAAGDAAARSNSTNVKLVTLPKNAYLTLTVAGAANAKASKAHVLVTGELTGPR